MLSENELKVLSTYAPVITEMIGAMEKLDQAMQVDDMDEPVETWNVAEKMVTLFRRNRGIGVQVVPILRKLRACMS